jgi:hypothetical protein
VRAADELRSSSADRCFGAEGHERQGHTIRPFFWVSMLCPSFSSPAQRKVCHAVVRSSNTSIITPGGCWRWSAPYREAIKNCIGEHEARAAHGDRVKLAHHPERHLSAFEITGEKALRFSFPLERGRRRPKYVCGKAPSVQQRMLTWCSSS